MALRILTLSFAMSMLVLTGCQTSRSSYQPAYRPAVVAVTPVAPTCPNPQPAVVVPPPPGAIIR